MIVTDAELTNKENHTVLHTVHAYLKGVSMSPIETIVRPEKLLDQMTWKARMGIYEDQLNAQHKPEKGSTRRERLPHQVCEGSKKIQAGPHLVTEGPYMI